MNLVARNCILNGETVKRKLRRMAFEIVEKNTGETELVIAGIHGNGEVVARNVMTELRSIGALTLHYVIVELNKKQPKDVRIQSELNFDDKIIIVADDVANSGRTLLYALKPFLERYPKKIQTLVLVERSHKLFPVHTDYVGLSVSTTLQDHIVVETDGEIITGAWLH